MGLGATRSDEACPGGVLLLPGAVRPLLGIFGRIGSYGTLSPIVHTIPLFVKFVKPPLRGPQPGEQLQDKKKPRPRRTGDGAGATGLLDFVEIAQLHQGG
jgi:hypothetical protein